MKLIHIAICSVAFAIALASSKAHAFAELSRHGYSNCTACHVSPSGGGALTQYGRELSVELMSASVFAKPLEGEGGLGHSLVKLPTWLNVGGDVRAVAIHRDTPQVTANRMLLMQADAELAGTFGEWTVAASGGQYQGMIAESRRHYVNYRPSEQLSFRAGKFQPAFGLGLADHTSAVRRTFGWDEGSETYNLEAAWLGDRISAYATGTVGRLGDLPKEKEKGGAFKAAFHLTDRMHAGFSYFHGAQPNQGGTPAVSRDILGPFAILGFTSQIYLMSEIDFQWAKPDGAASATRGFGQYHRLNWEPSQGWNFYLLGQSARANFASPVGAIGAYGLGLQLFPRTHFEFDGEYLLQKSGSFPSDTLTYMTLLMHYYL